MRRLLMEIPFLFRPWRSAGRAGGNMMSVAMLGPRRSLGLRRIGGGIGFGGCCTGVRRLCRRRMSDRALKPLPVTLLLTRRTARLMPPERMPDLDHERLARLLRRDLSGFDRRLYSNGLRGLRNVRHR